MTVYRTEIAGLCFQPRATVYLVEADPCSVAGQALTGLATPWTDGSWWPDLNGRLIGWTDYPSQADVDLANSEAGQVAIPSMGNAA